MMNIGMWIDKALLAGVYAVLLAYPVTMFVYDGIRSEYFGILVLLSLLGLVARRIKTTEIRPGRVERLVLWSLFSITVIAWVSYACFDFPEAARPRVAKYSWFALSIPVYYLFRYTRPRMEFVWAALVAGALVAFSRAVLEELDWVKELLPGMWGNRANGAMHPIRFGDLALLLGFLSLAGALYLKSISGVFRVLGFLGFLAGLLASVLSQSRGGWVAMPFLLLMTFLPMLKGNKRLFLGVMALIMTVGVVMFNHPAFQVEKRAKQAWSDIEAYASGNPNTSLGARFDMFLTAWRIFVDHPLFGVGVGNYHEMSKRYYRASDRKLSSEVIMWKNPHNELLLHAATRGLVGVLTLVSLFGFAFYAFARQGFGGWMAGEFASIAGLNLMVGYSIFGMSIALFEHRDFLMFFVVYLTLFLSGLANPINRRY
jgi:O-antigen ligase